MFTHLSQLYHHIPQTTTTTTANSLIPWTEQERNILSTLVPKTLKIKIDDMTRQDWGKVALELMDKQINTIKRSGKECKAIVRFLLDKCQVFTRFLQLKLTRSSFCTGNII
jgi:hypothetical protein